MTTSFVLRLGAGALAWMLGACDDQRARDSPVAATPSTAAGAPIPASGARAPTPSDTAPPVTPPAPNDGQREGQRDGKGEGQTEGRIEGRIGVPECDAYLEKYAACLMEKVPEESRKLLQDAMDQSARAWRDAAAGPAKDGLAATCRLAGEAAKQATESLGCTW